MKLDELIELCEPVLARALREVLAESERLKNALRAILSGDIPTSETAAVCRHALGLHLSDFQRELARDCYYDADVSEVTIPDDLLAAAEAEQQTDRAGRSEP